MDFSDKTILVTGSAGFIGFHLCKALLKNYGKSIKIIGLDNINDYYDIKIKKERLRILHEFSSPKYNYSFIEGNLVDRLLLDSVFQKYQPDIVVHLAAQVGVRYSIKNPYAYIESNLIGFFNILESCRNSYKNGKKGVNHLIYASSSSVYGSNEKVPFCVSDKTDCPISLYAATKKSNELMAYTYSKLYDIPSTGLRFFTVYGPLGRPDMAYYSFTDRMVKGETIQVYNYGDMYRDFTYIDDIVTGIIKVMGKVPEATGNGIKYKLYNIGNQSPKQLLYFIETLEQCLREECLIDKPIKKELLPMQPGDVYQTYADTSEMVRDFGFRPSTSLEEGLKKYVKWYKQYYI